MVWDAYEQGRRDAPAREYARLHGDPAAPVDAIIEGLPTGGSCRNGARATVKRHPARAEQLTAIDPEWNPRSTGRSIGSATSTTSAAGNRPTTPEDGDGAAAGGGEPNVGMGADGSYGAAASGRGVPDAAAVRNGGVGCAAAGVAGEVGAGGVEAGVDVGVGGGGGAVAVREVVVPGPGMVFRGVAIGRWVAGWARLNPAQREALLAVGVAAPVVGEAVTRRPGVSGGWRAGRSRGEAFAVGLTAAGAFFAREGHLEVPRGHVEVVDVHGDGGVEEVRLGVWVPNTRARRGKLTAERIVALDAVGMRW